MDNHIAIDELDPIKYYSWPIFGKYYWERVGIALNRCRGGDTILEIGFGSGVTFSFLSKRYLNVFGIEHQNGTSIANVRRASTGSLSNVYLLAGDAFQLPFQSESFTSVLLISVIEHFHPSTLKNVFKEINRIIKPAGQLIYGVPVDNLVTKFGFKFLDKDIKHHHLSNEKEIEAGASNFFHEIQKERVNFLLPNGIRSDFFSIYEVIEWKKPEI